MTCLPPCSARGLDRQLRHRRRATTRPACGSMTTRVRSRRHRRVGWLRRSTTASSLSGAIHPTRATYRNPPAWFPTRISAIRPNGRKRTRRTTVRSLSAVATIVSIGRIRDPLARNAAAATRGAGAAVAGSRAALWVATCPGTRSVDVIRDQVGGHVQVGGHDPGPGRWTCPSSAESASSYCRLLAAFSHQSSCPLRPSTSRSSAR
jgi:hypothetical protein